MRKILILLSIIIATSVYSQTKSPQSTAINSYTITRSKLMEVKILTDLITDIPTLYDWISYDITFVVGGTLKSHHGSGTNLASELIKQLAKIKAQSKLFIDLEIHDQKKVTNRSYSIYIKE